MTSEPRMFNRSGHVFLSIINTSGSLVFTGFDRITFENACSNLICSKRANLIIEFNTSTKDVWVNYFSEKLHFRKINDRVEASNVNVTIAIHNVTIG